MITCTMVVYLISSVSNHGYWMPVGEVYETRAECEDAIEKSGDQYKPHGAAKCFAFYRSFKADPADYHLPKLVHCPH